MITYTLFRKNVKHVLFQVIKTWLLKPDYNMFKFWCEGSIVKWHMFISNCTTIGVKHLAQATVSKKN